MAQLIDGPAAHQFHIAFDFGSEIFKRPFNAGLTRLTANRHVEFGWYRPAK